MASLWKKNKSAILLVSLTWTLPFLILWPYLFFENSEGIVGAQANLWADWAAHMSYASVFAFKNPSEWFTHHPIFVLENFNYPFITSLISGGLIRMGLDRISAFIWPTQMTTVLFFFALSIFFNSIFENTRKTFFATTAFLLSGGLGFLAFLKDVYETPSWQALIYPARPYTRLPDQHIEFINVITSEFVPQRSFFLGFPLALISLTYLFRLSNQNFKNVPALNLIFLGFGSSLIALVHTHSVIALALISLVIFAMNPKPLKAWLTYGLSAISFGILIYSCFLRSKNAAGYFGFHIGWMAEPKFFNIISFWWLNWGIFLPVAILGTWRLRLYKNSLVVAGFALFLFCNIFQISPWIWDNTKILTWSYLLLAIPVIHYLAFIWSANNRLFRGVTAFIFFLTIFSGLLDVMRLFHPGRDSHVMWSTDDIQLAEKFQKVSKPSDIILVSPQDVHHWAARLTGRQVVLGYTGTAWSYGFNYLPVEEDIRQIYRGSDATSELIKKYKIDFISIGASETTAYNANEAYFRDHFEKILENGSHRVYRVGPRL